ncbi:MAG: response regulator [Firmicutes bacterium]|nr:response regulator [Bacillota bacterium]
MHDVLIVEDEKPLRDKLTMNIDWKSQGYRIYEAGDGEEALGILKQQEIDILVTDIQMPKMNGIELVRRAKTIYPDLWVIIISGYGDWEYTQVLNMLGVDEYLLKPFRSQRLLDIVNNIRTASLLKSSQQLSG